MGGDGPWGVHPCAPPLPCRVGAAADAGAQIINISLGGYSTTHVLDAAIDYATTTAAAAATNCHHYRHQQPPPLP
jgi:hypothetical protein